MRKFDYVMIFTIYGKTGVKIKIFFTKYGQKITSQGLNHYVIRLTHIKNSKSNCFIQFPVLKYLLITTPFHFSFHLIRSFCDKATEMNGRNGHLAKVCWPGSTTQIEESLPGKLKVEYNCRNIMSSYLSFVIYFI